MLFSIGYQRFTPLFLFFWGHMFSQPRGGTAIARSDGAGGRKGWVMVMHVMEYETKSIGSMVKLGK